MRTRLLLATALAAVAAIATTSPASAAQTRSCASADLRYPFQEGMPADFGVLRLRIAGGTCETAHAVAQTWQRRFERSPTARLPRTVRGFRLRALTPNAAQTYRLRGTRGASTVRFDYMVPNG